MKKKLALILAATMTVGLLTSCGGSGLRQRFQARGSGTSASASQTSDLKVGVFYYNFADAYITTVRTAMDKQLDELGVQYQNFDAQTNQGEQLNQVNTAISDGYNLLVVNVVENASPDAAQNIADAAKAAGIPVVFFNRDFDVSVWRAMRRVPSWAPIPPRPAICRARPPVSTWWRTSTLWT